VPGLAVLSTAAHVGDGIYASVLQPNKGRSRKARFATHIKSSIAVKQSRIIAVELKTFLVGDEHRDAGAIFGMIENLRGLIV